MKLALNTCKGRVIQLEKKIFIERRDRGTTTELFDLELDRNQEQRKDAKEPSERVGRRV